MTEQESHRSDEEIIEERLDRFEYPDNPADTPLGFAREFALYCVPELKKQANLKLLDDAEEWAKASNSLAFLQWVESKRREILEK